MASKKYLVDIDLAKNSLNNARIQNLSSDPSSPVSGQAYYNTVTNRLRIFDGTVWIEMGSADDAGVSTVNGRTGAVVLDKTDVGLANVDNTSDATKPVSTAQQTALDGKQPLDADLTAIAGLSAVNNDTLVYTAGAWANRTPAQLKTTLALNNVSNTNDASKPVSTAQQAALDLKADITSLATVATTGSYDDLLDKPTFSASSIAGDSAIIDANPNPATHGPDTVYIGTTRENATASQLAAEGTFSIYANTDEDGNGPWDKYITLGQDNYGTAGITLATTDVDGYVSLRAPQGLILDSNEAAGPSSATSAKIKTTNITAQRTFELPDASGTVATEEYTDAAVAAIVESAPGTLDTLNELAAALGDDANFATTTATSLSEKLVKTANLSDVANAATAFGNIKQAATTSATGVVELATQAEAQAKTDTTRALTAASVADFARKYTALIGDNSATSIAVTHGLGSQWVTAQVFDASTNALVEVDVTLTSGTQTTFTFAVAPATNAYRVVITG